ncbi:hypothetical protein P8452_28446 [Trifolium repens]|nr:hypothetical protein P8452_28446 [Trifolium repens]
MQEKASHEGKGKCSVWKQKHLISIKPQGGFGLRKLWQDYELCLFVQWNYLPMLCGINRETAYQESFRMYNFIVHLLT